jgi:hypothetical protein
MGQMEMKCIFDIGKKISLFWPRLLRWAMWPMGLLFKVQVTVLLLSGQKKKCVCFRLPDLPYFFAPDPKLFFDHFEKKSGNRHVFPNWFYRVWNQIGRTQTASLPQLDLATVNSSKTLKLYVVYWLHW